VSYGRSSYQLQARLTRVRQITAPSLIACGRLGAQAHPKGSATAARRAEAGPLQSRDGEAKEITRESGLQVVVDSDGAVVTRDTNPTKLSQPGAGITKKEPST